MTVKEMHHVLKEEGLILWYDFFLNNPANPDVRGIRKRQIAHLVPDCHIDFHGVSLAPPLARVIAPYSWSGCNVLERIRLFVSHYLIVIKRN